ncbi:MAG TPA: hypothetical protein VFF17_15425 [Thermoanaerobaculia bacterium]|nr:hypothetical protein [Thermoanaerobaculia bacterium]
MLVPLFPRVTGMKIENVWGRGARGLVRCTARLTRALRAEESERINRLLKTSSDGSQVVHECRPEEVEEWHTRLVEALSGAWAPAAATVAASGGDERARPLKGNASPFRRRGQ